MTLQEKLKELTAEDGPNVPARTIALYCGTSSTTIIQFKNGKVKVSEQLQQQIQKGLEEYTQLMWDIVRE